MKHRSTANRSSAAPRWNDLRRYLELSPRHPRANFALIVLGLVAAGWVLQELVFGVSLQLEPHPLLRVLLAAMPLVLTSAVVLASRGK